MEILRVDSDYFFLQIEISWSQKVQLCSKFCVKTKERRLEFVVAKTGRQLQPQEGGEHFQ